MIPAKEVQMSWEVDYDSLITPSDDDIETGGFGSRGYSVALIVDATWEEASDWLVRERQAVTEVAELSLNEDEFDGLAREREEDVILDPLEGIVMAPDLGMRAACVALCAAGCVTAASCRGHPGVDAWSRWPVILFTCDGQRARILEDIARTSGCGLGSNEGRLELWAPSVEELLRFGALVIDRRTEFDNVPVPPAVARARGKGQSEDAESSMDA
jgi:hypothetical protein